MKETTAVRVQSKVNNYHSDGTGRDTYVSTFNGGFVSQELFHKLEPKAISRYEKMHFLTANKRKEISQAIPLKTSHYWGDGTGRDFFVIANDGGQTNPYQWKDHPDIKFASGLRNYHKTQYPTRISSACQVPNHLTKVKTQLQPQKRPHTPNVRNADNLYQSYQTVYHQTFAGRRYKNVI